MSETCAPWAVVGDVCAPCNDEAIDDDVLEDKLQEASDILYDLTGRQWPGICTDLDVRPCAERRVFERSSSGYRGWIRGGLWGACGCWASTQCGCSRLSEVRLGGSPIVQILEVKVDGVVQTEGVDFRVDDREWLVRLPGSDLDNPNPGWPCCQDLTLADTEVDTWSVSYEYGADPPAAGRTAAASLACQLALLCNPELAGKCRLRKGVVAQTRQGSTIRSVDRDALARSGMTGLEEVDLWLGSVRFGAAHQSPMIAHPLQMRRVRRPAQFGS